MYTERIKEVCVEEEDNIYEDYGEGWVYDIKL